jgi:hypothetical protein
MGYLGWASSNEEQCEIGSETEQEFIRHREGVEEEEDGSDTEQERRTLPDADHRSAWCEGHG